MKFLGYAWVATCLLGGLLLSSCENKEKRDTEGPVITLHGPEENEKITINNEHGMHFEADFFDKKGLLKSYTIDIHNNFDNHPHTGLPSQPELTATMQEAADQEIAFVYNNSWSLENLASAHVHHHEIKIMDKAGKKIKPGKYHFVLYAVDNHGNQSHVYRNIELVNKEHQHESGAHFHVHRMPTKKVYQYSNIINVALEGHSEDDPVKSIRIMLLPTSVVDKGEEEWKKAATPANCFAVMGEILDKNQKELALEAGIMIGANKDNAGGEEKGKQLEWKPGKYLIYAVGETVGGVKFYLSKKDVVTIEIR